MIESIVSKEEANAKIMLCEFIMCEYVVQLDGCTLAVTVAEGEEDGGEDGVLYIAMCDELNCAFISKDFTLILLDFQTYNGDNVGAAR